MDESEELGRGGLRLVEEALVFIFICFFELLPNFSVLQ